MKLVLTKEEVVASAIKFLKSENIINPDKEYTGTISEYDRKEYFVVTELKPELQSKVEETSDDKENTQN